MTIRAEVDGLGTLEFPDGTSGAVIEMAVQRELSARRAAQPHKPVSAVDDMGTGQRLAAGMGQGLAEMWRGAKQRLGLASQAEIDEAERLDAPLKATGAGAIGNVLGQVAPIAGAALALPAGIAASIPGAAALGAAQGFVQPTREGESAGKNALIGGALGGGAQWGIGKLAGAAGRMLSGAEREALEMASKNSVRDATLKASQEAGYVVPPSQANAGLGSRLLEGVSGKIRTAELAGVKNQSVTDQLARKALGLGDDAPLTSDTMKAIRAQAYAKGYEPLAKIGRIETDAGYHGALEHIAAKYQGAAADFPGVASDSVTKFINGAKSGGTPERSAWVDSGGKILSDFVEPPSPANMRSLLDELKKSGGISTQEVGELGVGNIHKSNPGLLRKGDAKTGKADGQSADDMLEWMRETGWINRAQIQAAEEMPGGATELAKDMVRSALAGEKMVHPAQADAWYAYSDAMQQVMDAGIKKITIPGKAAEQVGGLRGVKSFDADNAIKMTQILRDEAGTAFAQGDKALGKAKREAAKAIEDQIERGLLKTGANGADALKAFREARTLMAKTHTVENSLVAEGGTVNAKKIGAQLQRGKPLTDELRTIGAFANNYSGVAGIPKGSNPLSVLDVGFAAGTGNPALLFARPAALAARPA